MGVWASAAEARDALRAFINDGPTDRPVKLKQVVGSVDGTNVTFFAWDDRIIPGTLVLSLDGIDQPGGFIANTTDYIMGVIVTTTPPPADQALRARYYFQYFIDSELDEALQMAANQITETDDITSIVPGLKVAALNFGAHFGFQKQAIRWAQRMSSKFLLQEEPIDTEVEKRSNLFLQLAREYYKQGVQMRDSYYTRHGRRHAPAMGVYKPSTPYWGPRR